VLFNAESLAQAAADLAGLFGGLPLASQEALYCLRSYSLVLAVSVVAATPLPKRLAARIPEKAMAVLEPLTLTALLLICTAYLVDGSFNPFLYFRF
jgi:alginate O-acetyltransferase complex protein AlgI